MTESDRASVRPLYTRPGARYTCFGDGLCCTDIHGLGPISRSDVVRVRRARDDAAGWDSSFDSYMLRTKPSGGCVFLASDLRCTLHAKLGAEAKPDACRRFPLGLVATPNGGRITTEHRCPCRTLGERPELTAEGAAGSLVDRAGRLYAERRVDRVAIEPRRRISFEKWEAIERDMLERLGSGEDPARVLGAKPFPALAKQTWRQVQREFWDSGDDTQFGVALAWFADGIGALKLGKPPKKLRDRPWQHTFDRAEKRSPTARTSKEVLADWIADEIWSMRWTEEGSFARGRAELATRYAIARWAADRLEGIGVRPDRAAAEGIMMVEVLGGSDYWTDIVTDMKVR